MQRSGLNGQSLPPAELPSAKQILLAGYGGGSLECRRHAYNGLYERPGEDKRILRVGVFS